MKIGLKLFSTNIELIPSTQKLKEQELFDYIELYIVPNSYKNTIQYWSKFDYPFIIHAPHSYSGLNLSLEDYENSNRILIEEVESFREKLKPSKIIFHPGIQGSLDETIRQLLFFRKDYDELFASTIIENKPKIGLKQEICVGASPSEIESLVLETGLGFCLDIGHALCYAAWAKIPYEDILDRFLKLNPHMFHLSDGFMGSHTDSHTNFGFGDYPLPHIIKIMPVNAFVTIETNKNLTLNLKDFQDDVNYIRKLLCSSDKKDEVLPSASLRNNIKNVNLNIRNLQSDDIYDLFEWRNHPEIRKNSFNSNPVSLQEHEKWFKDKLQDQKTTIYIAFDKNHKIGTIRFEDKSDYIKVSVMLNPEYFGKGLGSSVIKLGTDKFTHEKKPDKILAAEIKTDNIASKKAFQKAGFKESHISYILKVT
jgi:RimJ/RimL family protein N-acetyltransferase/sugar phosphate isomerase/epimerase